MHDYQAGLTGYKINHDSHPLFDSSAIIHSDDSEFYNANRDHFFIDLFFQKRFFKAENDEERYAKSTPDALSQSWTTFVDNYNDCKSFWMMNLAKISGKYLNHSIDGNKMRIHKKCIEEDLPCAIPKTANCPMCYSQSRKMPQIARIDPDEQYFVMSTKLRLMIIDFDVRWNTHAKRHDISESMFTSEVSIGEIRMLSMQYSNSEMQIRMAHVLRELERVKTELKSLRTEQHESQSNLDALARVVQGKRQKI